MASRLISCVQLVILLYKATATQSIQNQLHVDSRLIENLCRVQGPSCQKLTHGTLLIPSSCPPKAQERDPLLVRFRHHATSLFVGHSLVAGGMAIVLAATVKPPAKQQLTLPLGHTHKKPKMAKGSMADVPGGTILVQVSLFGTLHKRGAGCHTRQTEKESKRFCRRAGGWL